MGPLIGTARSQCAEHKAACLTIWWQRNAVTQIARSVSLGVLSHWRRDKAENKVAVESATAGVTCSLIGRDLHHVRAGDSHEPNGTLYTLTRGGGGGELMQYHNLAFHLSFMYRCTLHSVKRLCVKNKLHGLSSRANCTHRATAACRRTYCQLLQIKCAMWSV
jgi:hypothetical protein